MKLFNTKKMKYVKKPIVIEAVQWNGENLEEVITFLGGADTRNDYFGNLYVTGKNFVYQSIDSRMGCTPPQRNYCQLPSSNITIGFTIITLEGDMQASVGDYIIKDIKGEYYPCKPDIFEQSYDLWADKVTDNDATSEGKENHILTENLDNLGIIGNTYPKLFEVLIRLRPTINDLLTNHGLFINLDYVLSNALDHKFRPHHISYKREGIVYTEISINYYGNKGAQSIVIRNEQDIEINFPEWGVQGKSLTFGENLMGITHNPSGNQTVNEIKTKFAEITDLINAHYESMPNDQFELLIIFQNCLQHLIDAQMNCVKLVTYKQK